MTYPTLASIKVMLGILPADTSKDAAIQLQLQMVLALIENFCGRHFALGPYQERFLPIDSRNPYLLLRAWPVASITEVLRDGVLAAADSYKLYPEVGLLRQFPRGGDYRFWLTETDDVLVKYVGGWDTNDWPAEFIDVLLQLFMQRWSATGGSGSHVDATAGTGQIKAFTVDAVRVEYDVGGGGSASRSSGAGVPPELAPFAAILQKFCDRQAYGV